MHVHHDEPLVEKRAVAAVPLGAVRLRRRLENERLFQMGTVKIAAHERCAVAGAAVWAEQSRIKIGGTAYLPLTVANLHERRELMDAESEEFAQVVGGLGSRSRSSATLDRGSQGYWFAG
jgi:hypothetical protein